MYVRVQFRLWSSLVLKPYTHVSPHMLPVCVCVRLIRCPYTSLVRVSYLARPISAYPITHCNRAVRAYGTQAIIHGVPIIRQHDKAPRRIRTICRRAYGVRVFSAPPSPYTSAPLVPSSLSRERILCFSMFFCCFLFSLVFFLFTYRCKGCAVHEAGTGLFCFFFRCLFRDVSRHQPSSGGEETFG